MRTALRSGLPTTHKTAWFSTLCVALLAGVLSQTSAFAQDNSSQAAALEGVWDVKTSTFSSADCVIYGTLRLQTTPDSQTMSCSMKLRQACDIVGYTPIASEQSCTLAKIQSALFLRAEVLNTNPPSPGYRPESFNLRIISRDEMVGEHLSAPRYATGLDVRITRRRIDELS